MKPARRDLFTMDEVCEILNRRPSTVRGWVARGLLPRYGTARSSLFAWPDVARAQDAAKPRRERHDAA